MQTLSHDAAKAFYDWLGARQDSQKFYEDAAVGDLIAHAAFGQAGSVFEFGCGTGRLAERLLSNDLPATCRYRAADVSSTMFRLAQKRLAHWGRRVTVAQTSGSMAVAAAAASCDRFVACYVLDLLSEDDIRQLIAEAHRVLAPGGLLCTVGLTHGTSLAAKTVGALWAALFKINPKLVGGCRAVEVTDFLSDARWSVRYANTVSRFGISSEVVVAAADATGGNSV